MPTTNNPSIICPVCGSKFELAAQNSVNRFAALRQAGVNTDNLVTIIDANGLSKLARVEGETITPLADNDPILARILNGGNIPNPRLYRRWVMSQVFHMLIAPGGFTAALQKKGYKYQWTMLLEELRVQVRLVDNDPENFADRNRWFNQTTVYAMMTHYYSALEQHIIQIKKRHYRNKPYIRFHGQNILVADITEKILKPIGALIVNALAAKTPEALYEVALAFYNATRQYWMPFDQPMCGDFRGAYKGAGAFFTMKNMILFHDCYIHTDSGKKLSRTGSLKKLYDMANQYTGDGWKLFGALNKFILDNNVNIPAKIASWRNS